MRFHSPACIAHLRAVCDEHELLLVLDEIATGFGRTGAMFASEHAGVAPDVMCVGKALTGGYMTLAATLCTAAVAEGVSAGDGGGLMHGPTFMGNPLACAVALASLDLLSEGAWRGQVRAIEAGLRAGLEPARELPGVAEVRVLGAIGVLQLEEAVDMAAATSAAVEHGVSAAPLPRPDLCDAALLDRRGGSEPGHGRDARRRAGWLSGRSLTPARHAGAERESCASVSFSACACCVCAA